MLSWFVDQKLVDDALNTKILIDDKMVLKNREYNHPAIGDDLNFNLLRKYFTVRGWKAVQSTIQRFVKSPTYSCNGCFNPNKDKSIIQCDHCLMWYHLGCGLLKKAPKIIAR